MIANLVGVTPEVVGVTPERALAIAERVVDPPTSSA